MTTVLVDGTIEMDEIRLFALIQLIIDAKACAKRLADLQSAAADLKSKTDGYVDTVRKLAGERAAIDQKHADAAQLVQDAERWQGQLNAQKKQLDIREGEIVSRETEAVNAVSNAKFRETKCGEWENVLMAKEAALKEQAAAADKKLEDAKALLADYDQAKHAAALKLAG